MSGPWGSLRTARGRRNLARRSRHVDGRLHDALAPYAAWCAFATALNASIARRNR